MKEIKDFGSWPSPLSADSLSASQSAVDICIDAMTQSVYWVEVVPSEQGRGQIFKQSLNKAVVDKPEPLLPMGYSCRSRVNEYGGGSFIVSNGKLIFSNDQDFAVYSIDIAEPQVKPPQRVTKENKLQRFADFAFDEEHGFLIAICEEHFENEQPKDVKTSLVAIQVSTGDIKTLEEGHDFYSTPRFSHDKKQLAYLVWDYPNMPWDYTQLYLANIHYSENESVVIDSSVLVNPSVEESIVQPEFGVDNKLYFVSDRSGFWNLYQYHADAKEVQLLLSSPLEQEFAGACWRLNSSWYKPFKSDPTKLVCINKSSIAVLDTEKKTIANLPSTYSHFNEIRTYINAENKNQEMIIMNVSSTTEQVKLVSYDVSEQSVQQVIKSSPLPPLNPEDISIGKEIAFPTTNDKTAYGYYYEPKNSKFKGPEGQLPPLRVLSHGGPTSFSSNAYSNEIQYWTTRGFAIVDVNYGGSTGYGREYRNRLLKQWGIVDVDDCCNAALYLAEQGFVDRKKLAIEGGSAGGYTTLASLTFRDVFNAGVCKYGISDITLLAKETHKFESRYPDRLIGEYPKEKHIYEERSPLFKADQIKCPVIFFHGKEDKVVPPNQAEVMVDALRKNGLPVSFVLYDGEAHGFRRAENIKRTLEVEQWFLGQIFGFEVDGIEGVPIENFPQKA
ncbi:unnamed protein product [Cunninghamella echinulata]